MFFLIHIHAHARGPSYFNRIRGKLERGSRGGRFDFFEFSPNNSVAGVSAVNHSWKRGVSAGALGNAGPGV